MREAAIVAGRPNSRTPTAPHWTGATAARGVLIAVT